MTRECRGFPSGFPRAGGVKHPNGCTDMRHRACHLPLEDMDNQSTNGRRFETTRLIIESCTAFAALAALIMSILSINNTQRAADKANQLAEQANGLQGPYRVTWYAHRRTSKTPWSLRLENRSIIPTFRTILLNDKEKESITIWTLPACTRVTVPLTDETDNAVFEDLTDRKYSLHFQMASGWWATDQYKRVHPSPYDAEAATQLFNHHASSKNKRAIKTHRHTAESLGTCG